MTTSAGQTFAGYEIIAKLGEGGMGSVWKARQPLLNRFVALKVMGAQLNTNQEFIARFIREAASAAALNHPNIVQVYTAGETEGTYYFVMEFVEGESLKKRLDHAGRIEPGEAIALTLHIAQALQYAWNEAKLIHRDIKPDNIFLSVKGVVKVGDLGLAKSVGAGSTEMTATGMMMGSPHYISPEQARALKDMDFRADIYSLGCTLYHMVSGRTAYTADDSLALVLKHVTEPPPDIRVVMPDCPPPLVTLIGKMMAKDRNERHASYEELIADLWQVHDALRQPVVAAAPVVTPTPSAAVPAADPSAATMAAQTEMLGEPGTAPAPAAAAPTAPRPKVGSQPTVVPSRKSPAMLYAVGCVAAAVLLGGLLWWAPWRSGSAVAGWQNAVNLLKLVELPRDAVKGDWKQRDGMVVATADHNNAQLAFPYHPPAEYDYRVKFLCLQGEGIVQTLVRDGHQFSWMMGVPGGDVAGFENISGAGIGESPARITRKPMVTTGNEHISLVEVRNDGVRGYLDGELLAQWKTDYRDMSVHGVWRLPPEKPIAVGTYKSSVQIHAAEVREVTGKGTFTQTTPATRLTSPATQHAASVFTNAVGGEMVAIPPGEFMLGSTKEEREWAVMPGNMGSRSSALKRVSLEGERQPRQAMVRSGFWMGRTEVTVGQWRKFVDATGGYPTTAEINGVAMAHGGGGPGLGQIRGASWRKVGFSSPVRDEHPVVCISWEDATAFCKWLTERERTAGRLPSGYVMRLPTEAEWEYACRGGKQGTRFWWGDAKEDGKDRLNWSKTSDADDALTFVDQFGERGCNGFGLADMAGNAWEWCLDNLDPAGAHVELYTDNSSLRVLKGGAFDCMPLATRCASREGRPANTADFRYGFRVCCGVDVPGGDAFVKEVAALPAEEQVARVVAKLKKLNPGYDGQETHKIEGGSVVELEFSAVGVTDITPVGALRSLRSLRCNGAGSERSSLRDLSPLKGLPLKCLSCEATSVDDLSPLTGMPLDSLSVRRTEVADLSPLKGMTLSFLNIAITQVGDLSPLRGMQLLRQLICATTSIADLSPLADCRLEHIECDFKPERDAAALRSIKTLERINNLLVAEFWSRVEAGDTPQPKFGRPAKLASAAMPVLPAGTAEAALKQPGSVFTNSVGAEMVYILPGELMLGSTKEEQAWALANELKDAAEKREGEAPRKTAIKDGFWLGRTEVTVGQWKEFVAATGYKTDAEKKGEASYAYDRQKKKWERNVKGASWRAPGFDQQDNHPVCCVSWNDAAAFCEWLTERERKAGRLSAGQLVRLPTEAEWEYACRAGTQAKFWWGEAKEDGKDRLNWSGTADGFEFTSPVDAFGERGRNKFALADMLGNVYEWCLDDYDSKQAHEECYKANPGARVLRSGAFNNTPAGCRCASRLSRAPSHSFSTNGFRVAVGVDVVGGDAFIREVAALPAEQRVARVVAKLKELNPDFDGKEKHKIEGSDVVELEFSALNVTDISPVRALKKLRSFVCVASTDGRNRSKLADLTPLRGLPLEKLRVPGTDVSDLSPVAGMPLSHLGIGYTRITDLSPLKGAPLDTLMAQGVPLQDLSPLRGMPLTTLWCDEAVAATPANQEVLKSIPTLKTIKSGK